MCFFTRGELIRAERNYVNAGRGGLSELWLICKLVGWFLCGMSGARELLCVFINSVLVGAKM